MNSKITPASIRFILLLAALFSPFAWVSHTRAAPTLTCDSVTEIPAAECSALADLFASTRGVEWTNHTNWFETAAPSSWYGITVSSKHVVGITLDRNNLSGPLPPEVWNLTELTYLNLTENELAETLPPSIGNLSRLTELRLEANQLSGPIPPEIGNLSSLMRLHLGKNLFSGSIPPELGNLTNLRELSLMGNQLTGPIPPELGNLSNLTLLDLFDNQLSGSVPLEIGSLTALEHLNLGLNQLTGSIPPEIGKLTALKSLNLGVNQLTGIIPDELANLTQLLDPGVPGSYDGLNLSYNLLDVPDPYPSNPPTALQSFLMQKQPDWYLTQPTLAYESSGSWIIESRDGRTLVGIFDGVAETPAAVRYVPLPHPSQPAGQYTQVYNSFRLEALDAGGNVIPGYSFRGPMQFSFPYKDNGIVYDIRDQFFLLYWDAQSATWKDSANACTAKSSYFRYTDWLSISLFCPLSEYALVRQTTGSVYLPFVARH